MTAAVAMQLGLPRLHILSKLAQDTTVFFFFFGVNRSE